MLTDLDKGRIDGWHWARASEHGDTYPLPGNDVSEQWAQGFVDGRQAYREYKNS